MRGIENPGSILSRIVSRNPICTSSVLLRRSLLERYGTMDEDPHQRGSEDYELWLRLASHTMFAWIEEPLVIYRVTPTSLSGNATNIARGIILAQEKVLARDPDAPLERRLSGERLKAWQLLLLGKGQLYDGVEHCGRDAFRQSLAIDRRNVRTWIWLALSFLGAPLLSRLRALAYRIL